MTASYAAPDSEIFKKLEVFSGRLGPYPHAPMQKGMRKGKGGSGWVRYVSPENEDFKVVVSPKTVEEYGAPLDPDGNEMVPVSEK